MQFPSYFEFEVLTSNALQSKRLYLYLKQELIILQHYLNLIVILQIAILIFNASCKKRLVP